MKRMLFSRLSVKAIALTGILVFAMVLAACAGSVVGSGNVTEETRNVKGFSEISMSGQGQLEITQGDTESLRIEAEDNILPRITTNVYSGRLSIGWTGQGIGVVPRKPVKFFVTVKDLSELSLSGSAKASCNKLGTDQLRLSTSGSGDINIKNVTAKQIQADGSGSAKFTLAGTTDRQDISINGSGRYMARDLASKNCNVSISGSGSAEVNAKDTLDVKISGSGDVSYLGNPALTQDISGSGRVRRLSE